MQRERTAPNTEDTRPGFTVALSTNTGRACAALHGELDTADSDRLEAVLDGLRGDGFLEVQLDLTGLAFLDAAGLRVLARADTAFGAAGGRLVLVGVRSHHRRLLTITGLYGILTLG